MKSEIRNPKPEIREVLPQFRISEFGVRTSFGIRYSVFGLLLAALTGCHTSDRALPVAANTPAASGSALRDDWVDPDTGHRVVRLSRLPGTSESFYFHQNGFTARGDKLVFENQQGGASRLMLLDWASRRIEPLSEPGLHGIMVAHHSRHAYAAEGGKLFAIDLDTRGQRLLAQLPPRWPVSTINADETLAAGTYVAGGPPVDRSGPKSAWFDKVFEARRPQCLFTVELRTGQTNVFHLYEGWLGHVQFSPTDPGLLMFCHEGPWHKVDRIWQIRVDGTGLRLMHKRSMPMEIAGHEFWAPDGKSIWFDLQMPRGEKFFLANVDLATGQEQRWELERDQWSVHFNISRDGKLFAGDGGSEKMVAHATNGKWIWLFRLGVDGRLKGERLVNMARHDYALEPNLNFSPDGKWIVFRGNFDGSAQVYAVEIARSAPAQARAGVGPGAPGSKL